MKYLCGPEWLSTVSDGEASLLEVLGVLSTSSLPLLPGYLWPGVVVSVRVPSRGQIDLFKNYSYSFELCRKNSWETSTQKM